MSKPQIVPPPPEGENLVSKLAQLYRHRFPEDIQDQRTDIWKILCKDWFSRWIPPTARVLEVGTGYCEFINNVVAAEKVGVDLNPESKVRAAPDVRIHLISADRLTDVLPKDYFDVVFMSNFLEHCASKDHVLEVLRASRAVLKPGGRILILGPNYRYCSERYYDFFDHHVALTDLSMTEGLDIAGFELEKVDPRTLPLTFRTRFRPPPILARAYLRMPFVWPLFGVQFFIVGRKPAEG